MTASAARYPNAVEKTFVVTGDAATSLAALFGMPTTGASSVSLELDKGVTWAIYLLKQGTKRPFTKATDRRAGIASHFPLLRAPR